MEAMKRVTRFSQLSAPRQALVRLLQSVNFGFISDLEIRGGEPVFSPAPTVIVEVKLEAENDPREESNSPDFELRAELVRLMEQLDLLQNGGVDRIDVRFGVPRRALIERPIRVAARSSPHLPNRALDQRAPRNAKSDINAIHVAVLQKVKLLHQPDQFGAKFEIGRTGFGPGIIRRFELYLNDHGRCRAEYRLAAADFQVRDKSEIYRLEKPYQRLAGC